MYASGGTQTTNGPGTQFAIIGSSGYTCTAQPNGTMLFLFNTSTAATSALTSCGNQIPGSVVPALSGVVLLSVSGTWEPLSETNGVGSPYSVGGGSLGPYTQTQYTNGNAITLPAVTGGLLLYIFNYNTTTAAAITNTHGGSVPSSIPPRSGVILGGAGNGWWTIAQSTGTNGVATLSSGTVTVSNAGACSPAAGCIYKLTNCGLNASSGIGTLSIGTVSAATSFVINSLGPTGSVLTTDASTVCWQIN
jgi:hypothetical protein